MNMLRALVLEKHSQELFPYKSSTSVSRFITFEFTGLWKLDSVTVI